MADKKGRKVNWKAFGIFLVIAGIAGGGIGYVARLLGVPMEYRGAVIGISIAVVMMPLYFFYFEKKIFGGGSKKK